MKIAVFRRFLRMFATCFSLIIGGVFATMPAYADDCPTMAKPVNQIQIGNQTIDVQRLTIYSDQYNGQWYINLLPGTEVEYNNTCYVAYLDVRNGKTFLGYVNYSADSDNNGVPDNLSFINLIEVCNSDVNNLTQAITKEDADGLFDTYSDLLKNYNVTPRVTSNLLGFGYDRLHRCPITCNADEYLYNDDSWVKCQTCDGDHCCLDSEYTFTYDEYKDLGLYEDLCLPDDTTGDSECSDTECCMETDEYSHWDGSQCVCDVDALPDDFGSCPDNSDDPDETCDAGETWNGSECVLNGIDCTLYYGAIDDGADSCMCDTGSGYYGDDYENCTYCDPTTSTWNGSECVLNGIDCTLYYGAIDDGADSCMCDTGSGYYGDDYGNCTYCDPSTSTWNGSECVLNGIDCSQYLIDQIGLTNAGTDFVANDNNGSQSYNYNSMTSADAGISLNRMAFAVDYGNKGMIKGHGRCSKRSATDPWVGEDDAYVLQQDGIVSTLEDETGQTGAKYCYCQFDSYTPLDELSSPWVFNMAYYNAENCADVCAGLCGGRLQDNEAFNLAFRQAMFESVTTCSLNENGATFSLNVNIPGNNDNKFYFDISASGEFVVDCGTNGSLSGTGVQSDGKTIDRSGNTTLQTYTCTYTTGGEKTITMDGMATGYNSQDNTPTIMFWTSTNSTSKGANAAKIQSVNGSLGQIFKTIDNATNDLSKQPRFYQTFRNTTNLRTVPGDLFASADTPQNAASQMFNGTFSASGITTIPNNLFKYINGSANSLFTSTFDGCESLTSIPSDLFASVNNPRNAANNMFGSTFSESGITTIPNDLFKYINGSANSLFTSTFDGCESLTSIPSDLFASVNNPRNAANNMFGSTFYGTRITSIPSDLFKYINGSATFLFSDTFAYCTDLTTVTYPDNSTTNYLPYDFFGGLDMKANYNDAIMNGIFSGANAEFSISCPAGTTHYETVYDGDFDDKVLCEPNEQIDCDQYTGAVSDGAGSCQCDTENGYYGDDYGNCTYCDYSIATWDGSSCNCDNGADDYPTCTEPINCNDYYGAIDDGAVSCMCDESNYYYGDDYGNCTYCDPTTSTWNGSECVLNGIDCSQYTGATDDGAGSCQCDTGNDYFGDDYTSCEYCDYSIATWDGSSCNCDNGSDDYPNCTDHCPYGWSYDSDTGDCVFEWHCPTRPLICNFPGVTNCAYEKDYNDVDIIFGQTKAEQSYCGTEFDCANGYHKVNLSDLLSTYSWDNLDGERTTLNSSTRNNGMPAGMWWATLNDTQNDMSAFFIGGATCNDITGLDYTPQSRVVPNARFPVDTNGRNCWMKAGVFSQTSSYSNLMGLDSDWFFVREYDSAEECARLCPSSSGLENEELIFLETLALSIHNQICMQCPSSFEHSDANGCYAIITYKDTDGTTTIGTQNIYYDGTNNYFSINQLREYTPAAGYTFDGWYEDLSDSDTLVTTQYTFDEDSTLYASVTEMEYYTINLYDGETLIDTLYANSDAYFYESLDVFDTDNYINGITPPTKPAYDFKGFADTSHNNDLWIYKNGNINAQNIEEDFLHNYAPGDTINLYAQWDESDYYIINLYDGETLIDTLYSNDRAYFYESLDVFGTENYINSITPPTKQNYTFNGFADTSHDNDLWIDSRGVFDVQSIDEIYIHNYAPEDTINLYAQWTSNEQICPNGTYLNANTCENCPSGYTSDAGATAKTQCYMTAQCNEQTYPIPTCPADQTGLCCPENATCEYQNTSPVRVYWPENTSKIPTACYTSITCNTGYDTVTKTLDLTVTGRRTSDVCIDFCYPPDNEFYYGASPRGYTDCAHGRPYFGFEGSVNGAYPTNPKGGEWKVERYDSTTNTDDIIWGIAACRKPGVNETEPQAFDTRSFPELTAGHSDSTDPTVAQECWCKITGWTPYANGPRISVGNDNNVWVYRKTFQSKDTCNYTCYDSCSGACAAVFMDSPGAIGYTRYGYTYSSSTNHFEQAVQCLAQLTLTFDANGGEIPTGGTTSATVVNGGDMPLIDTDKLPTRDGYVFDGYYELADENDTNKFYDANGAIVTGKNKYPWNENKTLYAHWTKSDESGCDYYTIVFDANTDDEIMYLPNPTICYNDNNCSVSLPRSSASCPSRIVRDNYEFAGWFLEQDAQITDTPSWFYTNGLSGKKCRKVAVLKLYNEINETNILDYADEYAENCTITLYAKWTQKYNITYYNTDYDDDFDYQPSTYNAGENVTLPILTASAGFLFDGWCAGEMVYGCDEKVTSIGPNETGDKAFTAQWRPTETLIDFWCEIPNNGVNNTLFDGMEPGLIDLFDDSNFNGLYGVMENDARTRFADVINVFVTNRAANTVRIQNEGRAYDDWLNFPTEQTYGNKCAQYYEQNMIVKAWFCIERNENPGIQYCENPACYVGHWRQPDTQADCYAIWDSSNTITYHDGDTIITTLNPKTYNQYMSVALPQYNKNGYQFVGWYREPDFSGSSVTFIENETGNIDLYAKMQPNEIHCQQNKYLPHNQTTCSDCVTHGACIGGTYYFNETTDQGVQCLGDSVWNSTNQTCACEDGAFWHNETNKCTFNDFQCPEVMEYDDSDTPIVGLRYIPELTQDTNHNGHIDSYECIAQRIELSTTFDNEFENVKPYVYFCAYNEATQKYDLCSTKVPLCTMDETTPFLLMWFDEFDTQNTYTLSDAIGLYYQNASLTQEDLSNPLVNVFKYSASNAPAVMRCDWQCPAPRSYGDGVFAELPAQVYDVNGDGVLTESECIATRTYIHHDIGDDIMDLTPEQVEQLNNSDEEKQMILLALSQNSYDGNNPLNNYSETAFAFCLYNPITQSYDRACTIAMPMCTTDEFKNLLSYADGIKTLDLLNATLYFGMGTQLSDIPAGYMETLFTETAKDISIYYRCNVCVDNQIWENGSCVDCPYGNTVIDNVCVPEHIECDSFYSYNSSTGRCEYSGCPQFSSNVATTLNGAGILNYDENNITFETGGAKLFDLQCANARISMDDPELAQRYLDGDTTITDAEIAAANITVSMCGYNELTKKYDTMCTEKVQMCNANEMLILLQGFGNNSYLTQMLPMLAAARGYTDRDFGITYENGRIFVNGMPESDYDDVLDDVLGKVFKYSINDAPVYQRCHTTSSICPQKSEDLSYGPYGESHLFGTEYDFNNDGEITIDECVTTRVYGAIWETFNRAIENGLTPILVPEAYLLVLAQEATTKKPEYLAYLTKRYSIDIVQWATQMTYDNSEFGINANLLVGYAICKYNTTTHNYDICTPVINTCNVSDLQQLFATAGTSDIVSQILNISPDAFSVPGDEMFIYNKCSCSSGKPDDFCYKCPDGYNVHRYYQDDSLTYNGHIDTYPRWGCEPKTYQILFRKGQWIDEHHYSSSEDEEIWSPEYTYDEEYYLPVNTFTRDGYYFTGWNTELDGSGTSYTDGQLIKNLSTGDTIYLYAQWIQTETTCDAGEYYDDNSCQTCPAPTTDSATNGGINSCFVTLNGGQYYNGSTNRIAICEQNHYCPPNQDFYYQQISDANDNDTNMGIFECPANSHSSISQPYCECDDGYETENGVPYVTHENVCIIKQNIITYDANGGTNHPLNPTSYNSYETTDLLEPYRDGYLFDGWYDNALNRIINNISIGRMGRIHLTAQWRDDNSGKCQLGTYYDGNICTPCTPGYYCLGGDYENAVRVQCNPHSTSYAGASKCYCESGYTNMLLYQAEVSYSSYDDNTWNVTNVYGEFDGQSTCNLTGVEDGNSNNTITRDNLPNFPGRNCWCRTTSGNSSSMPSQWTMYRQYDSEYDCNQGCNNMCAKYASGEGWDSNGWNVSYHSSFDQYNKQLADVVYNPVCEKRCKVDGEYWDDYYQICKTCESGSYYNGSSCVTCSDGDIWDYSTNQCVSTCPSDTISYDNQCLTSKFTMQTTGINSGVDTTFRFTLYAYGTYIIDWGDGHVEKISRPSPGGYDRDTDPLLISHTYDGTVTNPTIKMNGSMTWPYKFGIWHYTDNNTIEFRDNACDYISTVSGSLGSMFPTVGYGVTTPEYQVNFANAFYGCSHLNGDITHIFDGVYGVPSVNMFYATFMGCSLLTTMPDFSRIRGDSQQNVFYSTFSNCSSLTGEYDLVGKMFNISSGSISSMYKGTFSDSGLDVNISSAWFDKFTSLADLAFAATFARTDISTIDGHDYIPDTFLKNVNSAEIDEDAIAGMFADTNLRESCPENTYQDTDAKFDGLLPKVVCAPCPDGMSSNAGSTSVNDCRYTSCPRHSIIADDDGYLPFASPAKIWEIADARWVDLNDDGILDISSECFVHTVFVKNWDAFVTEIDDNQTFRNGRLSGAICRYNPQTKNYDLCSERISGCDNDEIDDVYMNIEEWGNVEGADKYLFDYWNINIDLETDLIYTLNTYHDVFTEIPEIERCDFCPRGPATYAQNGQFLNADPVWYDKNDDGIFDTSECYAARLYGTAGAIAMDEGSSEAKSLITFQGTFDPDNALNNDAMLSWATCSYNKLTQQYDGKCTGVYSICGDDAEALSGVINNTPNIIVEQLTSRSGTIGLALTGVLIIDPDAPDDGGVHEIVAEPYATLEQETDWFTAFNRCVDDVLAYNDANHLPLINTGCNYASPIINNNFNLVCPEPQIRDTLPDFECSCPNGMELDKNTDECVCSDTGYEWNTDQNACVFSCNPGEMWDDGERTCVPQVDEEEHNCESGQYFDRIDEDCKNVPTPEFWLKTTVGDDSGRLDTPDFAFTITATGQFIIDWGDGTVEHIIRTATSPTKYEHHYANGAVEHTIAISGDATGYNYQPHDPHNPYTGDLADANSMPAQDSYITSAISFYEGGTWNHIREIGGSLGAIFPTLVQSTNGLSGEDLLRVQPRFDKTFFGAYWLETDLNDVPNLFAGVHGQPVPYMFYNTFAYNTYLGAARDTSATPSQSSTTNLMTEIGEFDINELAEDSGFGYGWIINGEVAAMGSVTESELTTGGEFITDYSSKGKIHGYGQCSTRQPINQSPNEITANLPDNTGQYCYCHLDGYKPSGNSEYIDLYSPWLFFMNMNSTETCANACGYLCGYSTFAPDTDATTFREAMFNAAGSFELNSSTSSTQYAIPGNFFAGISGTPAEHMFDGTFDSCYSLNGELPDNLFAGISGTPAPYMYNKTFRYDYGLTGYIPHDLFGNISGAPAQRMFYETFVHCWNLIGIDNTANGGEKTHYIPPTFMANVTSDNYEIYDEFDVADRYDAQFPSENARRYNGPMYNMLYNTGLAEFCPRNMYLYDTKFYHFSEENGYNPDQNSDWLPKVVCAQCPNGEITPGPGIYKECDPNTLYCNEPGKYCVQNEVGHENDVEICSSNYGNCCPPGYHQETCPSGSYCPQDCKPMNVDRNDISLCLTTDPEDQSATIPLSSVPGATNKYQCGPKLHLDPNIDGKLLFLRKIDPSIGRPLHALWIKYKDGKDYYASMCSNQVAFSEKWANANGFKHLKMYANDAGTMNQYYVHDDSMTCPE